tara:strand:- start:4823 stop:5824 length:1002 start_codon:yes stop_codon:yes gene_type:complete
MAKPTYIIIFYFLAQLSFSQADKCTPILQKDFVAKIQGYNPMDLVPYNVVNDGWEEKWGLMDKKSKKKLTAPLMNYAATFNPDVTFFYEECDVRISNSYQLYVKDLMIYSEDYDDSADPKIQLLDSTNNFRGFEVDSIGNITGYSKVYFKSRNHYWNISKPFIHQNNYYAVVKNPNGLPIVINTKGESQLEPKYKQLRHTSYQKNKEDLLYVEDVTGNKGFITMSGTKVLYGELLKYPFYSNDIFGYSIQHDGIRGSGVYRDSITKSGVLDLTKMEWHIKPVQHLKIVDMVYTSNKSITSTPENRHLSNIYFVILNRKFQYLVDEKNIRFIAE